MTDAELKKMREWSNEKINSGFEPPWAWYQYMKLRETLDAIIAGRAVAVEFPDAPPKLRIVGAGDCGQPEKIEVVMPI